MLSERPAPFCGEAGIMTPGGPLKLERFAGEGYRNGEPSRAMLPPRAAELPGEDARWTVAEPVKERASMARATCCPGLFWVSPAVWPGGAGLASCELTVGFGRSSFSDLGAFEPIFVASVATIAARSCSVSRPDPSTSSFSNCAMKGATSDQCTISSRTSMPITNSNLSTPLPSWSREQIKSLSSFFFSSATRLSCLCRSSRSAPAFPIKAPSVPTDTAIWMHDHALAPCVFIPMSP
mmetsp:Transcript_16398/g.53437  ORF Transcript_16398/g.53437 Transcript_16398/m.53437 type:complete len:237 (-) Transcript_16398:697-1407(-)